MDEMVLLGKSLWKTKVTKEQGQCPEVTLAWSLCSLLYTLWGNALAILEGCLWYHNTIAYDKSVDEKLYQISLKSLNKITSVCPWMFRLTTKLLIVGKSCV